LNRQTLLIIALICLALLKLPASPQDTFAKEDFWKTAGLSLSVPAAGNLLSFLPVFAPNTSGIVPWIIYPSQLLAHLPLYGLNASKALTYTGIELLLPAVGVGLMFLGGDNDFAQQASGLALGVYLNVTQFSVYEVYKEFRLRVQPQDPYRASFEASSFAEVLAGEFRFRNLIDPLVWIPTIAGPALLAGYRLLAEGEADEAVWRTGEGYIGATRVHPAAGFFYVLGSSTVSMSLLAIGEEALYRGVIYEEIKSRTNRRTARIVDVLLFPLVHLPGDLNAGYPAGTVAFQFFWRAGMTLVFDAAYDKGGLALSATVHMWSDVVLLLVQWLAYGGVAQSSSGSGNRLPVSLPPGNGGAGGGGVPVTLRFTVPL